MINKLTPEQEADIQPTIDAWLKNASEPTDKEAAAQVVYDIYKKYGYKKPHVVFASSPLAAVILDNIWDDFWERFLGIKNKKGASLGASLDASLGAPLRDSLDASLGAPLRDSLRDSLGASVRGSLGESLNAYLRGSLDASLGAPLPESLRAYLGDSLGASLNASLRDSLSASLNASLRDSLGESLNAYLGDSLGSSLGASLNASLRDSLGSSLNASLGESLNAYLGASLNDSLGSSLGASLNASLRDSLGSSLNASLRDSLGSSLRAYLGDSLQNVLNPLIWHWWYSGYGVIDFTRRNLGLFENDDDADLWVRLGKNIQIMLPHENVVIISEKPVEVHFSETMIPKVLDYDHGMSVKYADGWGIYNLRGVLLNEEQYTLITSGNLDGVQIAKLSSEGKLNADQASVAWQFLGSDKLLKGMNAKLIATGTKHHEILNTYGEDECRKNYLWAFRPETELYEITDFMETGRTEYCIKMWHPSIEETTYIEWVEPDIGKKKDADLAQSVAFGIEKKHYMEAYEA